VNRYSRLDKLLIAICVLLGLLCFVGILKGAGSPTQARSWLCDWGDYFSIAAAALVFWAVWAWLRRKDEG
jgi:hypothetical protein